MKIHVDNYHFLCYNCKSSGLLIYKSIFLRLGIPPLVVGSLSDPLFFCFLNTRGVGRVDHITSLIAERQKLKKQLQRITENNAQTTKVCSEQNESIKDMSHWIHFLIRANFQSLKHWFTSLLWSFRVVRTLKIQNLVAGEIYNACIPAEILTKD